MRARGQRGARRRAGPRRGFAESSGSSTRWSTTSSTRTGLRSSSESSARTSWRPRSSSAREPDWPRSRPTRRFWTSSFGPKKLEPRLASLVTVRKRLDVLLVERGLAESRAQAQALVMAGLVPGLREGGPSRWTSRGAPRREPSAVRLARRREARCMRSTARASRPRGASALDVGASTGGFTDVLLQRGAARVDRRSTSDAASCTERLRERPARDRPRTDEARVARVAAVRRLDLAHPCDVSFIKRP